MFYFPIMRFLFGQAREGGREEAELGLIQNSRLEQSLEFLLSMKVEVEDS